MIDALSGLNAVAPDLAAGRADALGRSSAARAPVADFGTTLRQVASDAVQTLRTAEATSLAGMSGKASAQAVVEAVMAAEQTLQGAIAVRDKLVSAYLELTRMQI